MFSERTHGILCEMASSSYIIGKDVQEAFRKRVCFQTLRRYLTRVIAWRISGWPVKCLWDEILYILVGRDAWIYSTKEIEIRSLEHSTNI